MEITNNEDPDTLDALYTEYLGALRDVILRIENEEDINLCKQWLEVFNESSNEQKVARNCLIMLLYQQLKSNESLSEPFTDLSNIGRDFSNILQDVGIECVTTSKRSVLESGSSTSHEQEQQHRGHVANTPRASSRSDTSIIPKSSNHLRQIDDLNKFITNMRTMNDTLQNELRVLRREKEFLQMKNERKNQEMQKLLNVVKGCSECRFSENNVARTNTTIENQKDLFQIYPRLVSKEKKVEKNVDDFCEDFSKNIKVNENDVYKFLNVFVENLRAISVEENPLEKITDMNFSIFSRMFENCSSVSFQTRIVLYENSIEHLTLHIVQSVKNFYTNQLKMSSETMNINKSAQQSCGNVACKASQTKSVSYKICKSSSEYSRSSSDKLKIVYLRKCLLKLQNSRDKIVEKYENKLKEQMLHNKIQQKIMRLKLASITSKIFLQSNYKNQEELFQLANHLEAKYKDIVAEAVNKLKSNI